MNSQNMPPEGMDEPTPEEIMSALFANMVIQNTNMALMFLGKVPHPQTGQPIKDLESAQMFIDQLEMLAYKTRGNLGQEEKQLLSQSLISLRMTFVEELRKAGIPVPEHLTQPSELATGAPQPKPEAAAPAPQPPATAATPPSAPAAQSPAPAAAAPAPAPAPAEEESRKRFTKKY
jgi:hypothetical protein